ncbi:cystathionine gamma-synthase 1, chloroplastic-like [Panicum virgatum]|uniref:cystathionine gamma-synthase 1, chloroplastic-like n=1 Tax=Panicum virgatum TaxID=38727 RepID=UPI0019D57A7E|nr:cystathionine gamma-synthase 1, chloroplastic-like [Panicum virgatum]
MAPSTSLGKISLPRQQRRLLQPLSSPKHKRVAATPPAVLLQELFGDAQAAQPPKTRRASDETLAVHAGEKLGRGADGATTDSIATPIVSGTTHWFKSSEDLIAFKEGRRHSHEYGRYSNPTVKVLEDKISALERAEAVEATLVTSSGMNAIVATLLALVPPGGHIVTTTDCYSEARAFIGDRLSKMGIRSTFIDLDDMESLQAVLDQNDVTLVYADSPTNPLLKCVDIRLVAELCHRKGALVCIDSTLASPINQKPLTLGADIVVHSATKYMAGHHDVIAGCVSGSEALISKIRAWQHDLGGAISPNAAYMIIRGLKTMALRVEAHNLTALQMARLLECHPKIERVHYPGLESNPWHQVAKSQMTGYGGVVSFEVKSDLCGTMRFVDALEIPLIATSLGGCESLVQQPAVMSFWGKSDEEKARNGIKDNLVRFSFGIEKFEDLRDDVLQALEKI